MAAPEGNTNAKKASTGIQINFYLSPRNAKALEKQLVARGDDSTQGNVRAYARALAKNGVQLATSGKCEVDGCFWAVEIECRIGACAPLKRYCAYHYEQVHLPVDEHNIDQV